MMPLKLEALAASAEETLFTCVSELTRAGQLEPGSMIVLGCSTSEVAGDTIGKGSVPEMGAIIAAAMVKACAACGMEAA